MADPLQLPSSLMITDVSDFFDKRWLTSAQALIESSMVMIFSSLPPNTSILYVQSTRLITRRLTFDRIASVDLDPFSAHEFESSHDVVKHHDAH